MSRRKGSILRGGVGDKILRGRHGELVMVVVVRGRKAEGRDVL
jgi:hypothetical protein